MAKFMTGIDGRWIEVKDISTIFPFLYEKGHIVSLVGGGGKTSLLYYFAQKARQQMERVAVTTTTHICKPEGPWYAKDLEAAQRLWNEGEYAVVGLDEVKKLSILSEKAWQELSACADFIGIEADGSKRCPCKVPIEKEPVILPESDIVVAVLGMSALNRPLKEVCFRKEKAMRFLGVDEEHLMTEQDFVRILSSEEGSKKAVNDKEYIVILNQCDTVEEEQAAGQIAEMLYERGIKKVISCCMDNRERNQR